jgi:antitoxin FitA
VWANLTIKNVPQPVLRRLEARATLHRRSLNLKVIACLESLVQSSPLDVDALLVRVREIRRTSRWPDLRVPFVTADRQVLVAFPSTAVSPADFVG